MNLRIPGPTPCPPEVLEAVSGQMINHRGAEFAELISRVTSGLKQVFQTKNDVLILTASGTGALEAMVVNTLSPGDRVLAVSIGAFGDRLAGIAQTYGADVVRLEYEWGRAADPEDVRKALAADATIKAVLVTHNETSTGVTNPLAEIARVVKEAGRLVVVDAISSLGSIPVPVDEWKLDVVASGSQKGWMVPPGLAFVSMSDEAWRAYEAARMPRVYFDLKRAKESAEKGQTPWTPAVSLFYGMDVALRLMLAEGLEQIYQRHARLGQFTREGVKALGLELFADERFASNTVTTIKVPEGLDGKEITRRVRRKFDVELAGGQAKLSGKVFRIGHLGLVSEADLQATLDALRAVLPALGFTGAVARQQA